MSTISLVPIWLGSESATPLERVIEICEGTVRIGRWHPSDDSKLETAKVADPASSRFYCGPKLQRERITGHKSKLLKAQLGQDGGTRPTIQDQKRRKLPTQLVRVFTRAQNSKGRVQQDINSERHLLSGLRSHPRIMSARGQGVLPRNALHSGNGEGEHETRKGKEIRANARDYETKLKPEFYLSCAIVEQGSRNFSTVV